jgi:hypothetical protein
MAKVPELGFLVDEHLLRLEPVFFHDDGVYAKTQRGDQRTLFVTGRGVAHALRPLLPPGGFEARVARRNRIAVRLYFEAECRPARPAGHLDELRYFVESLLPSFSARDCCANYPLDVIPSGSPPPASDDPVAVIESLARVIPPAALPIPSVLMLGRFRALHVVKAAGAGYYIRHENLVLVPTGEEIPAALVELRWRVEARLRLSQKVAELNQRDSDRPHGPDLARAQSEIDRQGFFQAGDLLFLPGKPPLVGHLIPPHRNRALRRDSFRDLAVVAPLSLPPQIVHPRVYTRSTEGRWVPLSLRHGVCLGPGPPALRPETPGLSVLAYLRWAAARIAANGIFHAADERDIAANQR